MENDKKVVPICGKCEYKMKVSYYCSHPDSPITDFLTGDKFCGVINKVGQCRLYEGKKQEVPKSPVGSITVDLTLNTEPFKKKMAELLLAGL